MHHLIIDRGADAGRIALIVQERGNRLMLTDELLGVHIQLSGAHAGLDGLTQAAEHLVEKRARLSHQIKLLCVFEINHWIASSVLKISSLISSRLRPPPIFFSRPASR